MKTKIKKATKVILGLITALMLCTVFASASSALKDGQYTVNVQAIHATSGEVSKADNSITKPVKLEVKDSKINVILEMSSDMYDLAVQNKSGGFDLAQEVSENISARKITYRFPVSSIDEPILVEVVVGAMGSKVKFKIAFDKASLKNVSAPAIAASAPAAPAPVPAANPAPAVSPASAPAAAPQANTAPAAKNETTVSTAANINTAANSNTTENVANPETGDHTLANLSILLLSASIVSILLYGIYKRKSRKSTVI